MKCSAGGPTGASAARKSGRSRISRPSRFSRISSFSRLQSWHPIVSLGCTKEILKGMADRDG